MYKWEILYRDSLNNIKNFFIIKANSKQEAINKATKKVNNNNLNNFDIKLQMTF